MTDIQETEMSEDEIATMGEAVDSGWDKPFGAEVGDE